MTINELEILSKLYNLEMNSRAVSNSAETLTRPIQLDAPNNNVVIPCRLQTLLDTSFGVSNPVKRIMDIVEAKLRIASMLEENSIMASARKDTKERNNNDDKLTSETDGMEQKRDVKVAS